MVKSALQKYETQLAAIWRIWTQLRKFSKLVLSTNPSHLMKLLEIAYLYGSSKRFWATNNPKYLSKALSAYFSLRGDWLQHVDRDLETGLEILGWVDGKSFPKIKVALSKYRVRRVFRPDVWYLKDGSGGFFSGFSIQAPMSDFSMILNLLGGAVPGFQIELPQDSLTKLAPSGVGRLESIAPLQGQLGLNWYSAFHISPRELTWIVEAAADKEVAELALASLSKFGDFDLGGEILRCIAKYCLVLGFIPAGIRVRGWSLTPIKKPKWVELEANSNSWARAEKSNVNPKYFQANNVSVTNGGVLLSEEGFLDWDSAQNPCLDFVAGNLDYVIGTAANMVMCFVRDVKEGNTFDNAILLGSRVDSNWFHFLIETLPRLLWLEGVLPPSIPVLVSKRIPATALEALNLVTKRDILLVDSGKATSVKTAFVAGPTVYHPDSQFLWNREDIIEVNLDSLLRLRETVLKKIQPRYTSLKTYWVRASSQRVVTNEGQVRKVLVREGYKVIDPADLTFEEQVRGIFESESLVTAGGASMSNFIFANDHASLTVLVSSYGSTYPMPKILASASGVAINYVSGRSCVWSRFSTLVERSHSSFRVSPRALIRELSNLSLSN
jgi:hypothetical protein